MTKTAATEAKLTKNGCKIATWKIRRTFALVGITGKAYTVDGFWFQSDSRAAGGSADDSVGLTTQVAYSSLCSKIANFHYRSEIRDA